MEALPAGYALFVEQQQKSDDSWPKHHRYEFESEAARGGTAIVWRAFDLQLGRYAAVKVLQGVYDTLQMRVRLEREALIGARLDHHGVVSIFDFDTLSDGRPFIAMKWIEGRTLSALLEDGSLKTKDYLLIFKSICEVLKHTHERNVIHRDLKPANIFVDRYGQVHVVDWGLAKYIGTTESHLEFDEMPTFNLNTATALFLALGLHASEQANGEVDLVDKRSDVFALGCILFRLLTGKHVYSASSHESMCLAARSAELAPAMRLLRSTRVSRRLKRLTADCIAADPSKRPINAGDVHES